MGKAQATAGYSDSGIWGGAGVGGGPNKGINSERKRHSIGETRDPWQERYEGKSKDNSEERSLNDTCTSGWEKSQWISLVQSLSCVQLCDSVECNIPRFPVHHQFLELAQAHVHCVSDVIQPSHPLLSPSPPTFNLSQHQCLFQMNQFFKSGGQSIGASASASVLPMNIQDWFPLWLTGLTSLQSKGLKSLLRHYSSK